MSKKAKKQDRQKPLKGKESSIPSIVSDVPESFTLNVDEQTTEYSLNISQAVPSMDFAENVASSLPLSAPLTPPPPPPPSLFKEEDIGPDCKEAQTQIELSKIPLVEAVDGIHFDFALGYRIVIPKEAPKPEYEIRLYDMRSGLPCAQHVLKPGQGVVGDAKFFIPYRLEILSGGSLLYEHNYDCTGKKVHVVIPDGGLGDNLAWLPLVDLFRQQSKADVCCVMGEWMIRLAGDLYPGLNFMSVAGKPKLSNAYANYFCGIFDRDHKSWRPIEHQQLGMQGAVEAILGIPQGPVKCRLHKGSRRPFPEPYVCISTLATNPGKFWNFPDGWNEIIRFLKKCGYRVMDIDKRPQFYSVNQVYTIPSEAEDFTGAFPIQERINLLEHADFFIGLPSGLSWLAWNVDVPVVMISGFTMPSCEFPTPYRVTNYLYCHGCWNDSDCFFDQKVPIWCPRHSGTPREIECTRVITPLMVREAIMKIPVFQQRLASMMASGALSAQNETVSEKQGQEE